jgi:hypothetical protein
VIRSYTSAPAPAADPPGQTVSILWRNAVDPLAATAGMHRVIWDLRAAGAGGRRGGGAGGAAAAPLVGTFTVRLTANGQTQTKTLTVKPDPRR